MSKDIFPLCFILSIFGLIYFLFAPFQMEVYVNKNSTTKYYNKTKPLILFYTKVFGEKVIKNDGYSKAMKKCRSQCEILDDPLLYPYADIAIFHSRDMKMDDYLQKHRSPNILNIYFTMEAWPHEKIRKKYFPKDFFNLTKTHRLDSDYPVPYGKFQKILPSERKNATLVWSNEEVENAISKKKDLAVIFVSHCITHSFREKLTEDMKRYANISTFGACYNSTKFNVSQELEKHFFYLAFENSICKDYVTEKFWRIKDLIVPVVMKRSILNGIVDDDYFIAADDFNSTQALVERLVYLSKNLTEYKKYFGWTKKYKKVGAADPSELCRICEMAIKKEKHIIPDIYEWWEDESQCQSNYLNFTLNYLKSNNLTTPL